MNSHRPLKETSHAPHQHANEELVIIREGTVDVLVNGEWNDEVAFCRLFRG